MCVTVMLVTLDITVKSTSAIACLIPVVTEASVWMEQTDSSACATQDTEDHSVLEVNMSVALDLAGVKLTLAISTTIVERQSIPVIPIVSGAVGALLLILILTVLVIITLKCAPKCCSGVRKPDDSGK